MRIISADSHVLEPHDLCTTRLAGTPFADRAPKMIEDGDGGHVIAVDGLFPFPIGLAEVERTHAAGLRGAMVPGRPPEGHYAEARFDPLWAALSERRMPVSFHILTGGMGGDPTLGSGIVLMGLMSPVHQIQLTLLL